MSDWDDVDGATADRHEKGSNLRIAMTLYNAGGGTVESLTEDWELSEEESVELMRRVKEGWAEHRWSERRQERAERRTP